MGFFNGGTPEVKYLLKHLLNINMCDGKGIVIAPTGTSKNKDIRSGVPHCLFYGFHGDQLDELEERQKQEQRDQERRGSRCQKECQEQMDRISRRILIPNQLTSLHCRSRSPSPLNDLNDDVQNVHNINHLPRVDEILANPDNYRLKVYRHHSYFEALKPNILMFETNGDETMIKIVVDICSCKKFPRTRFVEYMRKITEQCVQQCLASLSHGQDEITGIAFVPDGIKMVKVQKQSDEEKHGHKFIVKEFELVNWDDSSQLYALLDDLQNTMA